LIGWIHKLESEEFDFLEDWAKKQFNEMDSDIAIKLLESAVDKGNGLQTFLKDRREVAKELGKELMKKGVIRRAKEDVALTEVFRNALAVGVDSSRQAPWRVLSTHYCPVTSAVVYFDGINSKATYDPGCPCKFYEEANMTPEEFARKIEEEMYRCEVSAIARVSSVVESLSKSKKEILLMIDGPIIDPPNKALYKGYVKERVNAVLACAENNVLVIGCVKSMEGHHFLNFLKRDDKFAELASVAEGFGPDTQLVPFVFSGIRSTGAAFQTVPIEILDPDWLIKEYKDAGFRRIYRIFLTLGGRGAPFGVEFLVREEEDSDQIGEKVCTAVRAWGIPGLNAPLPVIAAHRRCNIRKGASEYLYRQLLTRALSWEGGADILEPITGGRI
jgi:hypothetical protein